MPATLNATYLADLIDPQVIADYINEKLIDAIKFAPLATIDNTLVGTAGSKLTFPAYTYIGAADSVAEGTDIPIAKLGTTLKEVEISKLGKAVEFTDEAWLSGYQNNVPEEAAKQILLAINDGVEKKLLTAMDAVTTYTASIAAATNPADGIADALTKFGEDIDGEKVLLIPASYYARLRKSGSWIPNTEIGANAIISGRVGMVHGCDVVVSNRLNAVVHYTKTSDESVSAGKTYYTRDLKGEYTAVATPAAADLGTYYEKSTGDNDVAYIVKPGALRIVMKRDTLVEYDRDKIAQTNFIIGSKMFAPYVFDERKIIKITLGA